MATASRTLVCFSSALAMPRSAKTFPELGTTSDLFFVFRISHLIVRPGFVEPSANQFDIFPRRLYPAGRLLLERMKHVDSTPKFNRVNSAIGVRAIVLDHFEDPWSLPSPRFRARVFPTKLCNAEGGSNFIDNRFGESQQVFLARCGPEQRLLAGYPLRSRHRIIPVLGVRVNRLTSSNILVDKHVRDPFPKGAGNPECQPEVGVKSGLFDGV